MGCGGSLGRKEILHCVQDDNGGVFVVFVRDTVGAVLSRLWAALAVPSGVWQWGEPGLLSVCSAVKVCLVAGARQIPLSLS